MNIKKKPDEEKKVKFPVTKFKVLALGTPAIVVITVSRHFSYRLFTLTTPFLNVKSKFVQTAEKTKNTLFNPTYQTPDFY